MFRHLCPFALVAVAAFAQPANPPRLTYATYVGAASGSVLYGLAVDAAGYVYVSGASAGCAFLTKLNQTGTVALWSVCQPVTQVNSIALDSAGYIYIAGNNQTQPFTSLAPTSTIMKLSPDARQTIYSTSIGGTYASKLVLDRAGNAYITGLADSGFKSTAGAALTTGKGFAVKLNASGRLQYATYLDFVWYLGGSGDIAVDSLGQAWVVGATCPAAAGPVGSNCDLSSYGTANAIRKLDANGATLLVKKTFGGGPTGVRSIAYRDSALGVAVDATDSAWVVGTAESNSVPTTPGAIAPQRPFTGGPPGNGLGYAVKFSPSGEFSYGTYVGAPPPR